jgi:hypothetical protein
MCGIESFVLRVLRVLAAPIQAPWCLGEVVGKLFDDAIRERIGHVPDVVVDLARRRPGGRPARFRGTSAKRSRLAGLAVKKFNRAGMASQ